MRRAFAPALLVAVALAAPAPAAAEVVPQKGMKGIELGMTVKQVRAALGSPTRFRTIPHPVMGPARQWVYGLTDVLFDSTAANAKVVVLSTTSRAERTASGVGVGSSRAAVKRDVAGARCLVEFTYDHCFVGDFSPGETVTDFAIGKRRKVVTRITVGRVID